MRSLALAAALTPLLAAPLAAQETPYLDDRSSAAGLVRSLYNAVNRKEFARAWDYYGETKPSKDFDAFTKGYEGTERVKVATGFVTEEGAAGSVFYNVPVAIEARAAGGNEQVFAGCYVVRLANPQIQEPPFAPMHIEKGSLKPASGSLDESVPASCGDGPAPGPADLALAKARSAFTAAYSNICMTLDPDFAREPVEPEAYEIRYRYKSETDADPERTMRLFRFGCGGGAYNTTEVFYTVDDYGETKPVSFAQPELDIRYENDDFEGKVESMTIIGYRADDQVVNSEYSTDAHTITSFSKWRGIGDASSIGTWLFRDGSFTLIKYEVDATYDGEVEHETLIDFDTGP